MERYDFNQALSVILGEMVGRLVDSLSKFKPS